MHARHKPRRTSLPGPALAGMAGMAGMAGIVKNIGNVVLSCALIAAALQPAFAAPPTDWPEIALPANASRAVVGSQLSMDGVPLHITAFLSPERPEALAQWFRASL